MKVAWVVLPVLACAGANSLAAQLPDFTELVEAHAASVVNISTERRAEPQSPRSEEFDDFFRRFFP